MEERVDDDASRGKPCPPSPAVPRPAPDGDGRRLRGVGRDGRVLRRRLGRDRGVPAAAAAVPRGGRRHRGVVRQHPTSTGSRPTRRRPHRRALRRGARAGAQQASGPGPAACRRSRAERHRPDGQRDAAAVPLELSPRPGVHRSARHGTLGAAGLPGQRQSQPRRPAQTRRQGPAAGTVSRRAEAVALRRPALLHDDDRHAGHGRRPRCAPGRALEPRRRVLRHARGA